MSKVFYVGPGPDSLELTDPESGRPLTFERDGDGLTVENKDLAKQLLEREDFQSTKPDRKSPLIEKKE